MAGDDTLSAAVRTANREAGPATCSGPALKYSVRKSATLTGRRISLSVTLCDPLAGHHAAQFFESNRPFHHASLRHQAIDHLVFDLNAMRGLNTEPARQFGNHHSQPQ